MGNRARRKHRNSSGDGAAPLLAVDVGGQLRCLGRTPSDRDHGLPYKRMRQQIGLDLAELDAEPADLGLGVQPSEIFNVAVG